MRRTGLVNVSIGVICSRLVNIRIGVVRCYIGLRGGLIYISVCIVRRTRCRIDIGIGVICGRSVSNTLINR